MSGQRTCDTGGRGVSRSQVSIGRCDHAEADTRHRIRMLDQLASYNREDAGNVDTVKGWLQCYSELIQGDT